MLRHTFDPSARVTPWLGVGAGLAFGRVSFPSGSGTSGGTPGLIEEYAGWELLRLQGGFDVRSTAVFGVGVYGGVSFNRFDEFKKWSTIGPTEKLGRSSHADVEAGIRMTLFP